MLLAYTMPSNFRAKPSAPCCPTIVSRRLPVGRYQQQVPVTDLRQFVARVRIASINIDDVSTSFGNPCITTIRAARAGNTHSEAGEHRSWTADDFVCNLMTLVGPLTQRRRRNFHSFCFTSRAVQREQKSTEIRVYTILHFWTPVLYTHETTLLAMFVN